MEYYGNNDWRDYHLAHHGVKGMHWGIRRYQPYSVVPRGSGKGGKEIGEAKRGSGREIKKGVVSRIGIRFRHDINERHRAAASRLRSDQELHEDLSKASKTRLGQHVHNTVAANDSYKAQYHEMRSNLPLGERAISRMIFDGTKWKMPVQRLSGRTTTYGREVLNKVLTVGVAGVVLDAKYLLNDRKKETKYGAINVDKKAQKAEAKRIKQEQKTEAKLQKKAEKQANKDAKEYVTAKMYHGEGAGVRRREINNVVKDRQKDPRYKSAFEKAVQQQDMQKAVNTARRQRKAKDAGDAVKKTSRGVVNLALGRDVPATAGAIAIYNAAKVTGVDKRATEMGKDYLKRLQRGY